MRPAEHPAELFEAQAPPANLQPLEFDFGAAASTVAALRRAAAGLESAGGTGATHVARRLRRQADALHDRAAAVRTENARRADALRSWQHHLAEARRHYVRAHARLAANH